MKLISFLTAAMLALSVPAARALTPPAGDETLCGVSGVVQAVLQEDMVSNLPGAGQGQRVQVPVVALSVAAVAPMDAGYTGDFCNRVVPAAVGGGKATGYYRLCDANAEFMTGQTIRGVVGLSRGGGRYCLAQIQVTAPQ